MSVRIFKSILLAAAAVGSLVFFSRVELFRIGGPLMVPILVSSLLAFVLIFSKLIQLGSLGSPASDLLKKIFDLLDRRRIKEAIDLCDRQENPMARILKAGIMKYDLPKEDIRDAFSGALLLEMPQIEQHLSILVTVIQVVPLLGFVGTIVGLMNIFVVMQAKGASLATVGLADVSGGVWQALVCPAAAFLVVIPTLVATNYLTAKVRSFVEEAERASLELLGFLIERRLSL